MNATQVLDNFDRICDAPDAIPRLRRFILDLAVRGKLVEQDANDEPASAQLLVSDRVRKETAKEDRRADSDMQTLLAAEDRWDVPPSWEWRALADLALFIDYRGKTPKKIHEGVRLITAKNVKKGFINLTPEEFISEGDYLTWMTRGIPQIGDVLFTTEAPMGNAAVVRWTERFALAQRVVNFRLYGAISSEFLVLQLLADTFQIILNKTATGLTAKGIKAAKLKRLPVSVPPLAEQHCIVAKVDELMALCDRLEATRAERESRRDKLLAASLHRLNNGANADEFRDLACFHLNHLSRLTTRPEHIQQLRQTVLNLAVHGKLVPQDPNDEPASELLKRIQREKERLLKTGEIKRARPLAPSNNDALPFSIPSGWSWVRVQQLLEPKREISYGVIKLGSEPNEGGIPTLRCSDVRPRYLDVSRVRKVSEDIEREYSRTRLVGGEILLNIRGTLGGVALVPPALNGYNVAREVAVIPISNEVFGSYLVNVMASPYFWDVISESLRGIAYKGLNLGLLRLFEVPLPPLAEQHRIVSKIDELMALCDRLEAQLVTTQTESRRLLEAVLHEALNGNA